jgi:hypothetical protein
MLLPTCGFAGFAFLLRSKIEEINKFGAMSGLNTLSVMAEAEIIMKMEEAILYYMQR